MGTWTMAGEQVYLDTSGVLAYLDGDDDCHGKALSAWNQVLEGGGSFVMTDYVRLECWTLIQRRLGLEAVADFREAILPLCEVIEVGRAGFDLLSRQVLLGRRRTLSLVDLSSFDCMERLRLKRAIAFDEHFDERGYLTPDAEAWSA
jgi:predicted nucleic acid-binding protein